MKKYIFISILFLTIKVVFADDAIMGTVGGNVFLSKSSTIQMVKEVVNIDLERDGYKVRCRFWLVNLGETSTEVVGFPDYFYTVAEDTKPLKDFVTIIDGKIIKTEIKSEYEDKGMNYESARFWFTWNCTFPKNDTIVIDNSYTALYGGNQTGTCRVVYILGTGNSWNGPIKDGTIIFNHSKVGSNLFVDMVEVSETIKQFKNNDNSILKFNNYTPKNEEEVIFDVFSFWNHPYALIKDMRYQKNEFNSLVEDYLSRNGPKDKRDMINEIYAREGYVFKNKSLNEYYQKQKWYKPDSGFTENKLNYYEHYIISVLKESTENK